MRLGACHAIDLPFVFGSFDAPGMAALVGDGPEARALGASMQQAWVSFARTGEPVAADLSPWPRYDLQKRATMRLGRTCDVESGPLSARDQAWQPQP